MMSSGTSHTGRSADVQNRALVDQGLQRFGGAAVVEPVRHVALGRQVRQLDDLDRARMADEAARYVLRMLAAGIVIVGKDHYGLVGKPVAEAVQPLAAAARIRAGAEASGRKAVGILLALDNQHHLRGEQGGQAVGQGLNALHLPRPAAARRWIRASLAKILRFGEPDHLENKLAVLVDVVVGDHLSAELGLGVAIGLGRFLGGALDVLKQPLHRVGAVAAFLAGDQVEHATALAPLVVEPSARLDINRE